MATLPSPKTLNSFENRELSLWLHCCQRSRCNPEKYHIQYLQYIVEIGNYYLLHQHTYLFHPINEASHKMLNVWTPLRSKIYFGGPSHFEIYVIIGGLTSLWVPRINFSRSKTDADKVALGALRGNREPFLENFGPNQRSVTVLFDLQSWRGSDCRTL